MANVAADESLHLRQTDLCNGGKWTFALFTPTATGRGQTVRSWQFWSETCHYCRSQMASLRRLEDLRRIGSWLRQIAARSSKAGL